MKNNGIILVVLVLLVIISSTGFAAAAPTSSELKEYIQRFVDSISYQLPEPASTLSSLMLNSPELVSGGLRAWAYDNMITTNRYLDDALIRNYQPDIAYYEKVTDRWQAVYSCFNGDCSRMRELESADTTQPGARPEFVTECENGGIEICGDWTLQGSQYIANWTNHASAVLDIVEWDNLGVVLTRKDTTGTSEGLTARYEGTITGTNIDNGTVEWTQKGRSWKGTWHANLTPEQKPD
jgi:hypothetical protein